MLTITAIAKPGSPLSPLTTTTSYDPLYNKPTGITDSRGLVSSMSYDGATGNLTTSVSDVGGAPHFNARRSFVYNSVGQALAGAAAEIKPLAHSAIEARQPLAYRCPS